MGRSGGGGGFSGGGFGGGFSGGFGGGSSFGGRGGGFSGGGGRSGGDFGGGFGGPYHGGGYYGGGGGGFFGGLLLGNLLGGSRSSNSGGGGNVPTGGGNGPGGPGGNPHQGGSGASGCLVTIAVILAAVILVGLLGMLFEAPGCGGSPDGVTSSTIERTPLPSGSVTETPYYTDDDGDWIDDPQTLENGMRQFYMDTGVQPYLYILPNGTTTSTSELSDMAKNLYDELFTDGAHFLLVFCDNNSGTFNAGYYVGQEALTVMDSQALQIFQDYLKRYYSDYSISESEIFALTYEKTGKAIMTTEAEQMTPAIIAVSVALAVVIAVIVVALVIRRRTQAKEREQKRQQEILNTPLEKFADNEVENLAKKYEDARNDKDGDGIPDNPRETYAAPNSYERFGDIELEELEKKYRSQQQENKGQEQ